MKRIPLWVDATVADDPAAVVAAAKEVGAELIIGGNAHIDGADIIADDVAVASFADVTDADSQQRAVEVHGRIVVRGADWTIIPLENLIAARRDRPDSLYALATDAQTCGVFRDTLEVGVHGVLLQTGTAREVRKAHKLLVQKGPRPDDSPEEAGGDFLELGRVTRIDDAGTGDRVCIDTTSEFHEGEGLLVGSTARGFALVHAETVPSEFVATRPFRVNAGAIHSYLFGPDARTAYLSEARAGQRVLAVDRIGNTRTLTVGRAKIERRPHFLVAWETSSGAGQVVVQNAETIRFVTPDGHVSVTDLKVGDEILVHMETVARHFGMAVEERLVER